MAEPIDMLFGMMSDVGSVYHVLHGGSDPPMQRAILKGKSGGLL